MTGELCNCGVPTGIHGAHVMEEEIHQIYVWLEELMPIVRQGQMLMDQSPVVKLMKLKGSLGRGNAHK